MVTLHDPVPLHGPDQPLNPEPIAGEAVSVTTVPSLKLAAHIVGQLIPKGLLLTLPAPLPVTERVNGYTGTNVAVIVCAAVIVIAHVPVPEQEEDVQPAKAEPVAGTAVKVMLVPLEKFAEQVAPQLIPAGELVTVPEPVPAGVMVRVY